MGPNWKVGPLGGQGARQRSVVRRPGPERPGEKSCPIGHSVRVALTYEEPPIEKPIQSQIGGNQRAGPAR